MSTVLSNEDAARAVQLTRSARFFDELADGLISQLRNAMGVPVDAGAEVDGEFAQLRERLDGFYGEFKSLFGNLLHEHVGGEHFGRVMTALASDGAQAYFRASRALDSELVAALPKLAERMFEVAASGSASAAPSL